VVVVGSQLLLLVPLIFPTFKKENSVRRHCPDTVSIIASIIIVGNAFHILVGLVASVCR